MAAEDAAVRAAAPEDAGEVARLLHDFNTEFDEPTPSIPVLTERLRELLSAGEVRVFLAGEPPYGLALLRFRPSLWSQGPDAYLEELYVAPARRGLGTGRALMNAALELARAEGSEYFDVVTSEDDVAAIGLYESSGMYKHERGPKGGPLMLYYALELSSEEGAS